MALLTEAQRRALRAAEASPDGLERWRTGRWHPTHRGRRTPIGHSTVTALLRRGHLRVVRQHGLDRARITATGMEAIMREASIERPMALNQFPGPIPDQSAENPASCRRRREARGAIRVELARAARKLV